ncbi:MAG: protein kinase [Gammaproteobacteria bacterium]|nr:protein kinase [Gammaproteobacteria bacterium]
MQLKGYTDLTRLNRGGMATIYRGQQTSLNRTVAIKFLSAEYLWNDQVKELFDQESLVIAQLNHPNIIHVIDRGFSEGGRPYFVMEFIQGQDMAALMQQKQIPVHTKLNLIMQISRGLAFAHKNGVIHRDIKPANLLVDSGGHLKILDFGIAWLNAKGQPDSEEIHGTPDYMSPEQFSAPDTISPLSDIYSLGAVMYQLFVGKTHASDIDNWQAALTGLQPELTHLISHCLQTNPADRLASADEVSLQLLRILKGAHIGESQKAEARQAVGSAMDKFALLDVIKRDNYGAVYLFEDKSRKKLMVIKKRVKSVAGLREAKLLSQVDHPNLIKVLGTSKNDNAFIVVMQHLTGGSLQDRLSRPYAGDRFIKFALQICGAMQEAHNYKIIHGNLRPSNILFNDKEQICIADFGFDEHYRSDRKDWYQPIVQGEASVRRDIYAAAAIFHHMLTGEPLKFAHRRLQPSSAFEKLDSRLRKLLRDMLESDSNDYYDRFEQIMPTLKSLKGNLPDPQASGKSTRLRLWQLITGIMLINLAALLIYLYFA